MDITRYFVKPLQLCVLVLAREDNIEMDHKGVGWEFVD